MRLLARDGTIDALLLLRSNTIIDYTAAGEPELRRYVVRESRLPQLV
jgi:hypothetical protein